MSNNPHKRKARKEKVFVPSVATAPSTVAKNSPAIKKISMAILLIMILGACALAFH